MTNEATFSLLKIIVTSMISEQVSSLISQCPILSSNEVRKTREPNEEDVKGNESKWGDGALETFF